MTHLQEHWEGVSLPGNHTLERWLGGDDNAVFFQTSRASDGLRAVAKLIPEAAGNSAAQLGLWHRMRHLRHPNLIELLDCGRADESGEIVLYALFESPDDTLASALRESPLNQQDSREVLDSAIDALRYLHQQGLVLGALDPDRVVAVGDQIKFSTDAIREAANSSSYAEDVRALGEFWRQALLPAYPNSAEIAAHAADPDPQTRWTLAEIGAALIPPAPAVRPSAPPPAVSSPVVVPPVAVEPVVQNPVTALPPPHRHTPQSARPQSFPKWIFVGAAGVLLVILGLNLRRPPEVATQSRVTGVSLPGKAPAKASPVKEIPIREAPIKEAPAPLPKAAAPLTPKLSPLTGKEKWRVIAFTYRTHEAAAKKAHQLNQLHPDLHATVFSPKEKRGYYLIALGGRMNHEEAVRLQHTARGKGLPRDLYVQNYLE